MTVRFPFGRRHLVLLDTSRKTHFLHGNLSVRRVDAGENFVLATSASVSKEKRLISSTEIGTSTEMLDLISALVVVKLRKAR